MSLICTLTTLSVNGLPSRTSDLMLLAYLIFAEIQKPNSALKTLDTNKRLALTISGYVLLGSRATPLRHVASCQPLAITDSYQLTSMDMVELESQLLVTQTYRVQNRSHMIAGIERRVSSSRDFLLRTTAPSQKHFPQHNDLQASCTKLSKLRMSRDATSSVDPSDLRRRRPGMTTNTKVSNLAIEKLRYDTRVALCTRKRSRIFPVVLQTATSQPTPVLRHRHTIQPPLAAELQLQNQPTLVLNGVQPMATIRSYPGRSILSRRPGTREITKAASFGVMEMTMKRSMIHAIRPFRRTRPDTAADLTTAR
jgi:hypothetical protein